MEKNKTILAWLFIIFAIVLMVVLPELVYPPISEDAVDTHQYVLEVIMHIVRYVVLSVFSFIIGMKLLHKD